MLPLCYALPPFLNKNHLAGTEIRTRDFAFTSSFKFIDAEMNDEETFKVTLRMFIEFDLVNQFQIPYKVRFLFVKTYLKREQGLKLVPI